MALEDPKLIFGDCLGELQDIESGSVDMVMADPPYGKTACEWDSIIPLEPLWKELKRVVKSNSAIVMMASQPFTTTLISSNMKMFRYCWVWDKIAAANFIHGNRMPMITHEDIVVFYNKPPTYNSQKTICDKLTRSPIVDQKEFSSTVPMASGVIKSSELYERDKNLAVSIITFSKEKMNRDHPTQKPVALMEHQIKTYTNEGEVVLDFCMGSGTTGIACKETNRRFIGIEKDEFYFETAKQRIRDYKIIRFADCIKKVAV